MKQPGEAEIKQPQRIGSYWKNQKGVLAIVLVAGCVYNGFMAVGPVLQGKLIDAVSGKKGKGVIWLALLFLASVLMVQFARYFKRFYVRRFANRVAIAMRRNAYHNLLKESAPRLEREDAGNLMTRLLADVDLCAEGMRKVTTEIFDTGVLLLSYFIMMLHYDVRITLICCAFVVPAMFLAEKMKLIITRTTAALRTQSSATAAVTLESLEHLLLYRRSGRQQESAARYGHSLGKLEKVAVKAGVAENAMQPLYNSVGQLGVLPAVLLGGAKVLNGAWSVGLFSTYLTLFVAVASRASVAAKTFHAAQKARVSWLRLKPYLKEYEPWQLPPAAEEPGELVAEDLSFTYEGAAAPAFLPLSFSARPGELIAVTGPVGCGKSSLGAALSGLYSYEGSARLGGTELRALTREERAARIAWLGHEPQLFSAGIFENTGAQTTAQAEALLGEAGFGEDLAAMPQGLETPAGGGGAALSGGQQSRIALARTLAGHKNLIILDDPFAAVDAFTEEKILTRLKETCGRSIVVLISHRLRAFPLADHIIMMEKDKPALQGDHAFLMNESPVYREIYQLQQGKAGEEA
ncbi:ABC transporter ATP-binding protein [Acidaminobacterium chupaoyuni]